MSTIDAQTQAVLDKARESGGSAPGEQPIAEFRAAVKRSFGPLQPERQEVAEVQDITISPTHPGDVRLRIYRPQSNAKLPILVWAHGGSWVRCDVDFYDPLLRVLANRSRCVVVAVDYRLAPEHVFPAALDDVYAAARWAALAGDELGGDPTRLALGGDSSGGNLAAAAALLARTYGDFPIQLQALFVPLLDARLRSGSWEQFGEGYLLTRPQLKWALSQYAPGLDRRDPLLSPVCASTHEGLPAALIYTGSCDPLQDDGARYARLLHEAGVEVCHKKIDGLIHHAMLMSKAIDLGQTAWEQMSRAIGRAVRPKEGCIYDN